MGKPIIYVSEQGFLTASAQSGDSPDFIISNKFTHHQIGTFDAENKQFRPTHTDNLLSLNLLKDMVDLFDGLAKKFED